MRDGLIEGSVHGIDYDALGGRRLAKESAIRVVNQLNFGDRYDFVAPGVQCLRFTVLNNWAGDLANLNIPAGIAEIEFRGTVVPEPAAVSLLAVPALALMRRRRA